MPPEFQPEIVLMDNNLPGMSGVQAMCLIRYNPMTATLPVFALSANPMPSDIEQRMKAGFDQLPDKATRCELTIEVRRDGDADATVKFH